MPDNSPEFVPVLLEVRIYDLIEGTPGRCRDCPVGFAIRRLLQPGWVATITPTQISVSRRDGSELALADCPEDLSAYIGLIDRDSSIERPRPTCFEIAMPRSAVRRRYIVKQPIPPASAQADSSAECAS